MVAAFDMIKRSEKGELYMLQMDRFSIVELQSPRAVWDLVYEKDVNI